MANLLNERLNPDEGKAVKKKEKSKSKKASKQKETIIPNTQPQAESEVISGEDYIKEQKQIKRDKRKYRFVKAFMCFLCGYLIFLIYGVMVTTYDYDKYGNVTAQIMSKDDIKRQKEFSTLLGYYMDARKVYEDILILNYRVDKDIEDPLDLVPEYEELLEETSRIIIQLKATDPSKGYSQAYELLLNWVNADLSSYLQEISAAISQNSAEHMQNAINDKQRMYNNCYQLTANVVSLGENIKGVNISKLKEWSPEEFIKEEMGEV